MMSALEPLRPKILFRTKSAKRPGADPSNPHVVIQGFFPKMCSIAAETH